MMKKILIVLAVLLSSTVVFVAWETIVFLNSSPGQSSDVLYFDVERGDSAKHVAERLEDLGLVSSSLRFWIFTRLRGKHIRMGEYALSKKMFPGEVLKVIISGRSVERSITVQEGKNIYEIASLFEKGGFGTKEKFLKLCHEKQLITRLIGRSLPSLEGYLFPDTYRLNKFTGAKQLIEKMVTKYKSVYRDIQRSNETELSEHELVILASIIEKETGAAVERPIISSVYHNRLKKPMRLYADPTVLYGIWVQTGEYKKNLTKKDLRAKTAYNTYVSAGLPLGPIANPGKMSLLAAMRPQATDYFYFVSRNDGTHVFSTDYKSHLRAVRRFQLNRRAREGKSWRDLNKRTAATQ